MPRALKMAMGRLHLTSKRIENGEWKMENGVKRLNFPFSILHFQFSILHFQFSIHSVFCRLPRLTTPSFSGTGLFGVVGSSALHALCGTGSPQKKRGLRPPSACTGRLHQATACNPWRGFNFYFHKKMNPAFPPLR